MGLFSAKRPPTEPLKVNIPLYLWYQQSDLKNIHTLVDVTYKA